MEKKVYILENLDCANCAAKIEKRIQALPEISEATITFATRQLRVTAQDPDALLNKMQNVARTIEPDVLILPRQSTSVSHRHTAHSCHEHHGDACHCHEHEHGHEHEHEHGHTEDTGEMIVGAVLFLAGLICQGCWNGWWTALPFLLSYLVLGWDVLKTAGRNLIYGKIFDENFLMSLATLGALGIREFPEAAGVMLFYRIGEFFEHTAVERSRRQIMEAVDLRPEVVSLLDGAEVRVIPAEDAVPGDVLLVRPGDRIPLDGTVLSGTSRIDTAPITGEPVPVSVQAGSNIFSGCINTTGQLTIRVTKPLADSMTSRILESVEAAAAGKPKIDRFITRFAAIYTPVVVFLALGTAVIPSLITGDWQYWVYTALSFLVMSCPCALVLSVPLAFFSGIGLGSRRGILFKDGLSIEALAGIRAVVMDKTGTLTKGEFRVQEIHGPDSLLATCASCEQASTHPIAQSITSAAREHRLSLMQPERLEEIPGCGILANLDGREILCGNRTLLDRFGVSVPELPATPAVQVLVAENGVFSGYLTISDTPKAGARDAVFHLNRLGLVTAMLTGDRQDSAQAVATELGIQHCHGQLLPQQKLEHLNQIRQNWGRVLFVGDGINDAPVLAGADVGAAMGTGADAAIEAADVVYLTANPEAIPESLRIARQTRAIAWQNVIFALAVKIIVMILGLLGHASMWMAVFADSGVAMLCVLNSVRTLYRK